MRILHYALGFVPYRSGGLTRYVSDVTDAQHAAGHDVAMLWPGRMGSSKVPYIKRHRSVHGIGSFELCNPLPVVLDQRVGDPEVFHYPVDGSCYRRFFESYHPDIIHIHTLQGLHREFVDAAHEASIPTVFTTHDFFGLYPMNAIYPMDHNLSDWECTVINASAPSLTQLRILQSPIMRWVKSSVILRRILKTASGIRKARGKEPSKATPDRPIQTCSNMMKPYSDFRSYVIAMLNSIDCILYNSEVSKHAYERYCTPRASVVLPITHADMPKRMHDSQVGKHDRIHIAFLGGDRPYKGLSLIQKVASMLQSEKIDEYHFDVYGAEGTSDNWVTYHQSFDDFEEEMTEWDIVAVPSLTYESFGFVVPEALSCGIPAIVSDCVGAKELIRNGFGWIFRAGDIQQMAYLIQQINHNILSGASKELMNSYEPEEFSLHCLNLYGRYQFNINKRDCKCNYRER
ncbi:glycosyltransferase [Bifidobacterium breve]|uniref:glycosyltransferase n=1 Tax=Bifidobacterium breve TaxID=1685 RepID=UPI002B9EA029|nr:glycosyltransferase [Bifidobacterium breve]MEB3518022.1 glycosyltransferase [Bifidobacterium breve]